ncbi:MAG: hypothetical protein JNM21_11515 [Taibaiella sp.]|nr:hypothetical protein [Taibaiella sp.]
MPEEKILDKITDAFTSRLKVPIISTYVSVLVIYNWDVIFYLCFQKGEALKKIDYVKATYGPVYWERLVWCIVLALIVLCAFTVLNTLINFLMSWFYKKDKEITSRIEQAELIKSLQHSLAEEINKNELKLKNIKDLETIQSNLKERLDEIKLSEDDKKVFEGINTFINSTSQPSLYYAALDDLFEFLVLTQSLSYFSMINHSKNQSVTEVLISNLETLEFVQVIGRTKESNYNAVIVPIYSLVRVAFYNYINLNYKTPRVSIRTL